MGDHAWDFGTRLWRFSPKAAPLWRQNQLAGWWWRQNIHLLSSADISYQFRLKLTDSLHIYNKANPPPTHPRGAARLVIARPPTH